MSRAARVARYDRYLLRLPAQRVGIPPCVERHYRAAINAARTPRRFAALCARTGHRFDPTRGTHARR